MKKDDKSKMKWMCLGELELCLHGKKTIIPAAKQTMIYKLLSHIQLKYCFKE